MRKEINQEVLLEVIRKRSHPQPQVYTKEEQNIIDTALKKQVVKTCHTMHGGLFWANISCPECGKVLQVNPMKETDQYCPVCGQRIGWRYREVTGGDAGEPKKETAGYDMG